MRTMGAEHVRQCAFCAGTVTASRPKSAPRYQGRSAKGVERPAIWVHDPLPSLMLPLLARSAASHACPPQSYSSAPCFVVRLGGALALVQAAAGGGRGASSGESTGGHCEFVVPNQGARISIAAVPPRSPNPGNVGGLRV
jgi:hypothetical protein